MANQVNTGAETKSKTIKRLLAEGAAPEAIAAQVGCPVSYVKLVVKRVEEKGANQNSKKEQRDAAKAALLNFVKNTQDLASLKNLTLEILEKTKDQGLLVTIHEVNAL